MDDWNVILLVVREPVYKTLLRGIGHLCAVRDLSEVFTREPPSIVG